MHARRVVAPDGKRFDARLAHEASRQMAKLSGEILVDEKRLHIFPSLFRFEDFAVSGK
jgi:hypothetical protein